MAALFELLNYIDQKNERERQRKYEEVRAEAQRRSMNRMAVEEGKADALKIKAKEATDSFLTSKQQMEKLRAEIDLLSRDPRTSPETMDLYNNAYKNSVSTFEADNLKLQKINSEIKINAGTILNKNQKSFLDDVMEGDDPYDKVTEKRETETEDAGTGTTTRTTREGPASAFDGTQSSPYMPSYRTSSGAMFGNTAAGGAYDEPSPSFSYQPVRNQGAVISPDDIIGATQIDPASSQPNPNPVASQTTNPAAPAPKIGDFIRVKNKATGETGTLPSANARAAIASGRFEQVP